jgi:hypothetical protein
VKRPLCRAWLDYDNDPDVVVQFDVPSMEFASKVLSMYAYEAPRELKAMIKAIRIKRVR